ncbi:DUF4142 domain-containing protein [Streptomyces sp. PTM05]|uniref:DUF4142 domain-containing protein n=1 Tax=Streptantibioticus parmotrematis TaxID=2873249 RepID=A0ABS7QRA9_9ACTN|nr:DUF4142 domain-containing protein [Streptantibioticus parmotrematis]MBY8885727.1 DUF4142 domain-containing protein [Streptantibioticus parmotrematis]
MHIHPSLRSTAASGLVAGALVCTVASLVYPVYKFTKTQDAAAGTSAQAPVVPGFPTPSGPTETTTSGPLTAADREFVVQVRLSDLWELPAGQQAQAQGTTAAVRSAGGDLVTGHTRLDGDVQSAAVAVGVDLPTQPDAGQRASLTRLSGAQGTAYDRLFANTLHGSDDALFQFAAQIRADTQNSVVRRLATQTNGIVLQQIAALERTGLVDFTGGGTTAPPAPTPTTSASSVSPAPSSPVPAPPTITYTISASEAPR